MLLVWLFVPNQKVTANEVEGLLTHLSRVDFGGIILLGSSILLFLLPFELAGTLLPWSHPFVYSAFGLAVVLGLVFLLFEKRWAKDPIMPIHVLASRQLIVSNTVLFGQTAAQLGVGKWSPESSRLRTDTTVVLTSFKMMYTVPLYFQITQGLSATAAGARLLPAVLGVTVGGLVGGYLTKRCGLSR